MLRLPDNTRVEGEVVSRLTSEGVPNSVVCDNGHCWGNPYGFSGLDTEKTLCWNVAIGRNSQSTNKALLLFWSYTSVAGKLRKDFHADGHFYASPI